MGVQKTFDNNGGAGDGKWDVAVNWDPAIVPADTDTIVIAADCEVDSDESAATFAQLTINNGIELTIANGGTIYFDTGTCDFTGNFTVQTGGLIRFTDITELETNGLVTMDGGTIEIIETDGSLFTFEVRGSGIVGTSNGGTIDLVVATLNKVYLNISAAIAGDSGQRIIIKGSTGASTPYAFMYSNVEYVDFDTFSYLRFNTNGKALTNCLIHGFTTGLNGYRYSALLRDCFIYGNATGFYGGSAAEFSQVQIVGCVFGETEASVGDENTTADINGSTLIASLHDCKLSSTIPVLASAYYYDIVSTSHDQDETSWRQYQGIAHLAQSESGAGAQGGSGTAVKCVSSASAADTDVARFRRLVAVIPATHGDVIGATLYINGVNTKTAKLHIDPDSIYGTTQVYNETADGSWNQRTIPSYTVNVSGGAGTKVAIPIYLDITGASETWYYDTLDWTIT